MRQVSLKDQSILTVAPLAAEDAVEFITFQRMMAADSPMMMTEPDEYPSDDKFLKFFENNAQTKLNAYLMGKREGRIVASLSLSRARFRRTMHSALLGMMVHEACRGLGIGGHMVQAGVEAAQAMPVYKIDLHVRIDNPSAIAIYKKAGFEIEGIMRRGLQTSEGMHDVYYMGLCLD